MEMKSPLMHLAITWLSIAGFAHIPYWQLRSKTNEEATKITWRYAEDVAQVTFWM